MLQYEFAFVFVEFVMDSNYFALSSHNNSNQIPENKQSAKDHRCETDLSGLVSAQGKKKGLNLIIENTPGVNIQIGAKKGFGLIINSPLHIIP